MSQLTPLTFSIHGIDLSHYAGKIDWKALAASYFKFAYLKATQSSLWKDASAENWTAAKSVGLLRGAYHVFSFCVAPEAQADAIVGAVPYDSAALPIAVAAELYDGQAQSNIEALAKEGQCAQDLGPAGIQQKLGTLLASLRSKYKKKPILYGNHRVMELIRDSVIVKNYYMWIVDYIAENSISLDSPVPWTLWQFTNSGKAPGVDRKVDVEVFNGTAAQFAQFAKGE